MLLSLVVFHVFLSTVIGDDFNYVDHPCRRECDGSNMVCKYNFKVEIFYSLDSRACFNCPDNPDDCFRPDCILGGGVKKDVISVNRMIPGPAIDVCEGDTIIVKVQNLLRDGESLTVHWHGLHMKETPYMDGAPMVTQCPVHSHNNFTYTFEATEPGTHFYHSHDKSQRGDGFTGPLIVRKPKCLDRHKKLYDFDLAEHRIMIMDWNYEMKVTVIGKFFHGTGLPAPDGMLINGYGSMNVSDTTIPMANFTVKQGKKYRFRVISAAFYDCAISVSIDNHDFSVISSDGFDVEPQKVSSLVIFPGERYDFILEANQAPDFYWMRFKGFEECAFSSVYQLAVLKYEGVNKDVPSTPKPIYEDAFIPGPTTLNPFIGNEENGLLISELKTIENIDRELGSPYVKPVYIKIGFNYVPNPTYYRSPYYDLDNLPENLKLPTPQINDIVYEDPSTPVLQNIKKPEVLEEICSEESLQDRNCTVEFCSCPHVVKLPYNKVVEIIVFDDGSRKAHHPMHLHGYGFHVVAWGYMGNKTTKEDIQSLDEQGLIKRNFENPPVKDTIAVPNSGYAVLRFRTNNVGIWLFHCHVDPHAEDGMRMAFMVGEKRHMKNPPENFQNCGNFP